MFTAHSKPNQACFGPPDCKLLYNPTFWLFIVTTSVLSIGVGGFFLHIFPAYLTISLNVIALYVGFTFFPSQAMANQSRTIRSRFFAGRLFWNSDCLNPWRMG